MSSKDVIIDVQNVSKWFDVKGEGVQLGPSEAFERDADAKAQAKNKFQVLSDISFQVGEGETVGIVGRNGAGKSTLLRIISGMMKPDRGKVKIKGQAYSVMGMGVGLQQNLTGAENIMIKSSVMGLKKSEVEKRYDDIVRFAELGDYIDQPLRTYSKGMRARLAFAITFAFDPQILIVDEALSGGDGAFKRKAQARLNEINESGATILLVSHGGNNHKRLCDRSILIDKGQLISQGPPKTILKYYQRILATAPEDLPGTVDELKSIDPYAPPPTIEAGEGGGDTPTFSPNLKSNSAMASTPRGAEIKDARFIDMDGRPANVLPSGKRFRFEVDAEFEKAAQTLYAEICVKNDEGIELGMIRSHPEGGERNKVKAGAQATFKIGFRNRLLEGDYFVDVAIYGDTGSGVTALHHVSDMLMFQSMGEDDSVASGFVDLSR